MKLASMMVQQIMRCWEDVNERFENLKCEGSKTESVDKLGKTKKKKIAVAVAISHTGVEEFLAKNKKDTSRQRKVFSETRASLGGATTKKSTSVNVTLPYDKKLCAKVSNDVIETKNVEDYVTPQMSEHIITSNFCEVTPVYSTPLEVQNFNIWYYEQLANKKSTKPKRKNLKETREDYKYLCKSEMSLHVQKGLYLGVNLVCTHHIWVTVNFAHVL